MLATSHLWSDCRWFGSCRIDLLSSLGCQCGPGFHECRLVFTYGHGFRREHGGVQSGRKVAAGNWSLFEVTIYNRYIDDISNRRRNDESVLVVAWSTDYYAYILTLHCFLGCYSYCIVLCCTVIEMEVKSLEILERAMSWPRFCCKPRVEVAWQL
jgi:hypothetical protein